MQKMRHESLFNYRGACYARRMKQHTQSPGPAKIAGLNRRTFLRGTTAGLALFNILPGTLVQGAGRISANDKVNVAGIGVGSQGGGDIGAVAGEGQNIVALCDVDDNYAAKTFQKYPDAKKFKDFRVMFDKMGKGIDAVVIGTPDHTHALISPMQARQQR